MAAFDVDKGPIMEHQYPGAISGDENMLAELMLPDQAHDRNQDWTVFFLHKDSNDEDEDAEDGVMDNEKVNGNAHMNGMTNGTSEADGKSSLEGSAGKTSTEEEQEDTGGEGPPLIYVLNLVNTKQVNTARRYENQSSLQRAYKLIDAYRGAVVKAMAICTRHSFLHIYKVL